MSEQEPDHNYHVRVNSAAAGVGLVEAKRTKIEFDRSWGDAPTNDLAGPAELLAAALGACIVKNVERFSQVLSFSYESVSVDITIHRVDAPPHFNTISYVASIITTEPQRRVELLSRNISKHGTVYNTLAASCEIAGRIEAIAPAR